MNNSDSIHPANKLANVKRRVDRARNFPHNTCGASRHLHMIADALASGRGYPGIDEDPQWIAGSIYAVLESLWKARTRLMKLDPEGHAATAKRAERDAIKRLQMPAREKRGAA